MREIGVVIFNLGGGCRLDFGSCVKEIGIQNLLPVALVKPLDEGILIGLFRLDEPERVV